MNRKENVVKELRQKAEETARLDKKSKQFLFAAIPLFIGLMACYLIISFRPAISYNGMFMGAALLIFLCSIILCGIFLPFGKISEEKVERYFKDKLSQRIKDDEDELVRVSERKDELIEELKILKEL